MFVTVRDTRFSLLEKDEVGSFYSLRLLTRVDETTRWETETSVKEEKRFINELTKKLGSRVVEQPRNVSRFS